MKVHIVVETPVAVTPRLQQVAGIFDLPLTETSRVEWDVDLPLEEQPWNVGLIVGPSGCGKSTLARKLWPSAVAACNSLSWSPDRTILDDFPALLPLRALTSLLSSVGFSSPPAWLRPFRVLSTGQQFRVTLARMLAEALCTTPTEKSAEEDPIVFDEFTSVVDRTVAQIGSHALAKTVRAHNLSFLAVTCHEDVEDWLQPDWVYRPAEQKFAWRSLQRRPRIPLEVFRCQASAWPLFAPHHYLTGSLNRSAVCFLCTTGPRRQPVAFASYLPHLGRGPKTRREHRLVTLPDYQGAGIAHAVSEALGGLWKALGYRAIGVSSHPGLIAHRGKSPRWRCTRRPSFSGVESKMKHLKHAVTRLTASFEYIGPALPLKLAKALLGS